MLDQIHTLANRLRWLQPLAVVSGVVSLLVAGYAVIVANEAVDSLLIPSLLGFCWSLVVYSLVALFASAPPLVDLQTGFFRRLAARMHRVFMSLLALVFVVLTVTILWLSVRLTTLGVG